MGKIILIFFLLICLILFAVSFASASVSKLEIKFAPGYIAKTEANRSFHPSEPFTPFDDIVCEATASYDLAGAGCRAVLSSDGSAGRVEIDYASVSSSRNGEDTNEIYSFEFKGWPDGWGVDSAKMEKLIKNKKFKCEIWCKISGGDVLMKDAEKPVSSCVHLWGSDGTAKDKNGKIIPAATFKFVSMWGKSTSLFPRWIVKTSINDYETKYFIIDPFKAYKEKFSFYADIKEHDDSSWNVVTETRNLPEPILVFKQGERDSSKNAYTQVQSISSCNSADQYLFYSSRTYHAYAIFWFPVIFQIPDTAETLTVIHETGHSFVGLLEEYPYKKQTGKGAGEKNCVKNPMGFLPRGFRLGDTLYGDLGLTNSGKGCDDYAGFNVPSITSIMNNHPRAGNFNVISCIYLVEKILKTNYDEAARLCSQKAWNTLKPNQICILDSNCVVDGSKGCAKCDYAGNKCIYSPIGTSCQRYDSAKFKLEYGTCKLIDPLDVREVCDINLAWECAPGNEFIFSCVGKGFDDGCVSCNNHGKCIPANENELCTEYLDGQAYDGICISGKCISSAPD